jgi:hypothetical protein
MMTLILDSYVRTDASSKPWDLALEKLLHGSSAKSSSTATLASSVRKSSPPERKF